MKTYAHETLRGLRGQAGIDVRAFAAGRGARLDGDVLRIQVPLRALQASWRIAGWPSAEAITGHVDLVHSLDLVAPPTSLPLVVTVMDVMTSIHPDLFSPATRRQQEAHLDGARRAALVITASAATADDIVRVAGIPRERIVVTPLGHRELPPPGQRMAGLPEDYLLAVNVVEPRKAYDVLAEALNMVPGCPPLVAVGGDGWSAAEIRRQVREIDHKGLVRFIGHVDLEVLSSLYAGARLVIQPSLAEGFGLPLLEAMFAGVAVVATDIPQTREIAGNAALLIPAGDPEALAGAIERLLIDEGARTELGKQALLRSASFTWERTTELLVSAYQRAVG
jgi:glycosyltransferase involved in cell wall biosynthesis